MRMLEHRQRAPWPASSVSISSWRESPCKDVVPSGVPRYLVNVESRLERPPNLMLWISLWMPTGMQSRVAAGAQRHPCFPFLSAFGLYRIFFSALVADGLLLFVSRREVGPHVDGLSTLGV